MYYDLNYILESVKGEKRKEIVNNRETFDQEGSSTHQYQGDLTSSNIVLIAGSLLIHSNR